MAKYQETEFSNCFSSLPFLSKDHNLNSFKGPHIDSNINKEDFNWSNNFSTNNPENFSDILHTFKQNDCLKREDQSNNVSLHKESNNDFKNRDWIMKENLMDSEREDIAEKSYSELALKRLYKTYPTDPSTEFLDESQGDVNFLKFIGDTSYSVIRETNTVLTEQCLFDQNPQKFQLENKTISLIRDGIDLVWDEVEKTHLFNEESVSELEQVVPNGNKTNFTPEDNELFFDNSKEALSFHEDKLSQDVTVNKRMPYEEMAIDNSRESYLEHTYLGSAIEKNCIDIEPMKEENQLRENIEDKKKIQLNELKQGKEKFEDGIKCDTNTKNILHNESKKGKKKKKENTLESPVTDLLIFSMGGQIFNLNDSNNASTPKGKLGSAVKWEVSFSINAVKAMTTIQNGVVIPECMNLEKESEFDQWLEKELNKIKSFSTELIIDFIVKKFKGGSELRTLERQLKQYTLTLPQNVIEFLQVIDNVELSLINVLDTAKVYSTIKKVNQCCCNEQLQMKTKLLLCRLQSIILTPEDKEVETYLNELQIKCGVLKHPVAVEEWKSTSFKF